MIGIQSCATKLFHYHIEVWNLFMVATSVYNKIVCIDTVLK